MAKAKQTRAQLLWLFQAYLDKCGIFAEDRRENLSTMWLERRLSRATENDFRHFQKTNSRAPKPKSVMTTRGSRLALFSTWLDRTRPQADPEERERLIRLYNARQLSGPLVVEFHKFARQQDDGRVMP